MYSQKYIFQIVKMWKTKKNFFENKKRKSGRASFSGTGGDGDDHQFFLCGLM
jgi:hypothetical protein